MKTYLYRASNLSLFWPQFHSGSQFLAHAKNRRFLRFIHNNNYHNHQLLQMGFLSDRYVTYTTRYHSSRVLLSLALAILCGLK